MSRKSFGIEEYQALAAENELEFIAAAPPVMTRLSTRWKCLRCGRILRKSYDVIRHKQSAPCLCRVQGKTNGPEKYKELADRLGIQWIGETPPQNIKAMTRWFNPHDEITFEAPYVSLAYSIIPERYAQYLPGALY